MKNWYQFALFTTTLAILSACSSKDEATSTELSETPASPETILQSLQKDGLTCDTQVEILKLNKDDALKLVEISQATLDTNQIVQLIDNRNTNCSQVPQKESSKNDSDLGTVSQAITGTYAVEAIEETSGSGGVQPVYIYQDNSNLGCMCGSDCNDYIAEFDQVSGAYSNRSSLRIRGTNVWASCYLANPTMARIYSDNDIRACIGWWSVFFCGGGGYIPPQTSEIRVWR